MNIRQLAPVIRTKNAGPFIISADIIFDDAQVYEKVKRSGIIIREYVARLYRVPLQEILSVHYFDEGRCIKINIKRPVASGDIGDTDVLAMQQHAPLLAIDIPE
jgi:hypothetical protein